MSESSVITEGMKQLIGKEFGPVVWTVERGAIRKLVEAIEDFNPRWYDESRGEGHRKIVAPPTFCTSLREMQLEEAVWKMDCPLKRMINGGTELEFFQPIEPGDTISVTAKITDMQEREGKSGKLVVFTMERTYTNQRGEIAVIGRQTGIRH